MSAEEGGGGGHGEGEVAVLAVVNQAVFRPVVTVGIVASTGPAEKVAQRPDQRMVGHVRAALLGQQQEGDHCGAAGVEVTAAAAIGDRRHPAAAGPTVEVLCLHRAVHPTLDGRQDLLVAGAQVVFTQWDATVAKVPGVGGSVPGAAPRPSSHGLEVLFLACRK